MFIIYKITNLINDKVYIGKTCRDLTTRWKEHWSCALNKADNFYLHNAMRKYGQENFKIEQIDIANTIDELNLKEQEYITLYNALNNKTGYNLTRGGDGNQLYDWDEIRSLWDLGYSVKEISQIIGCYRGTIGQALKNYSSYSYQESLSRSNYNKKSICQYNSAKELVKTYPSIIAAARELNCSEYTISNCLRDKTNSALGYYWTYEGEQLPDNLKLKNKIAKRMISQYNLDNSFIKNFESAADAARTVAPNANVNSASSCILQVCKGNRKTAYGYKWCYAN